MMPVAEAPLGAAAWTGRTGGRLSAQERRVLLRPLMRAHLSYLTGRTRMALRLHPGRRASSDPHVVAIPDSALVRDVTRAAADLLSPALLNHSHRTYAWGAALAAIDGVTFDAELFYVASMLHDTGLPTPVDGVDFTVRSAQIAQDFAETHALSPHRLETIADAICLHHTPGVTLDHGPEAYLTSAGAAVDVFGLRSWELSDDLRAYVVQTWPRHGFKREFARLFGTEAARVPHGRAWLLHRYAVSDLTIRLAPFDE